MFGTIFIFCKLKLNINILYTLIGQDTLRYYDIYEQSLLTLALSTFGATESFAVGSCSIQSEYFNSITGFSTHQITIATSSQSWQPKVSPYIANCHLEDKINPNWEPFRWLPNKESPVQPLNLSLVTCDYFHLSIFLAPLYKITKIYLLAFLTTPKQIFPSCSNYIKVILFVLCGVSLITDFQIQVCTEIKILFAPVHLPPQIFFS